MTDRGSATVLALGLGAVLVLSTALPAVRGIVVAARHRAAVAADLAALAGAQSLPDDAAACVAASDIARANGGTVRNCTVSGDVVTVEVAYEFGLGRLGRWVVVRRARAGPALAMGPRSTAQPLGRSPPGGDGAPLSDRSLPEGRGTSAAANGLQACRAGRRSTIVAGNSPPTSDRG